MNLEFILDVLKDAVKNEGKATLDHVACQTILNEIERLSSSNKFLEDRMMDGRR